MRYIVIRTSIKSGKVKLCTFAGYNNAKVVPYKDLALALKESLQTDYASKYCYQVVEVE